MKERKLQQMIVNSIYGSVGYGKSQITYEQIKQFYRDMDYALAERVEEIYDAQIFYYPNEQVDYYLGIEKLSKQQFDEYIISQKLKRIKDL